MHTAKPSGMALLQAKKLKDVLIIHTAIHFDFAPINHSTSA